MQGTEGVLGLWVALRCSASSQLTGHPSGPRWVLYQEPNYQGTHTWWSGRVLVSSPSKGVSTSNWAATVGPGPGEAQERGRPFRPHAQDWEPRRRKVIKVVSGRPE